MENLLCDELIQEIFTKLPPSSCSSMCLVSKRWLCLYRSSTTSLSLRLSSDADCFLSLSSLLSQYSSLSSLRLLRRSDPVPAASSHRLLLLAAASCRRLTSLRFSAGPVSDSSLLHLSRSCTHLTSLSVSLSRPIRDIRLAWIARFPNLKELSIGVVNWGDYELREAEGVEFGDSAVELGLETVAVSGIEDGDLGFGWLWRRCKRLKKLKLRRCESIGDGGDFSSLATCLPSLQEVELRTCRTVADGVLSKLAADCDSLRSLLVYDGGSRDGLLQFMRNCRSNLQKLDFRLPLDLKNDHLLAAAANFHRLAALRLQSCCLVTGDGLKTLATATSTSLQELALINCDVIEREPGLLATLGQNLRVLRKLDLSFNDQLLDLELVSLMASCNSLIELKLRGCNGITNAAIASVPKCCPDLEIIDITDCCGIDSRGIESCVEDSRRLRRIRVEESKISDAAKTRASGKFIEMGTWL